MVGYYENALKENGLGKHGLEQYGLGQGQMTDCCQHSNEPLHAIKCGVCLQEQRDYLHLKKDLLV